jgi:chromosome segregation protein
VKTLNWFVLNQTIEHDLEATSALFQRLIQQSSPLQHEWQQAEKKLSELKMTLEQKQSLFQQNSSSLVQLEQQKLQTKERLQLSELQVETLTTQFDEQNESLLALEQQTQTAEQNFSDVQAQHKQAQQQFEQLKIKSISNNKKSCRWQRKLNSLVKMCCALSSKSRPCKHKPLRFVLRFRMMNRRS